MLIYLCLCTILLAIPYTKTSSTTQTNLDNATKGIELHSEANHDQENTKLIIPSEGGPVLPNASSVTLPKETHPMIIKLDKELQENKEKSVVPRKGVTYDFKEVSDEHGIEAGIDTIKSLNSSIDSSSTTTLMSNNDTNDISAEKFNKTKIHKPTVLSSKLLDELGEKFDLPPDSKIKKLHENSRPDLIMPIVITILVVPMFAVVAYMAVKRGKEAWKNRHYKRMDFLLDGMYND
ncbi:unnamed protein product [Leptosia nina]|uniref:Uncharacterized protein n=1 Tax=Leptosia nina TaxID=320188 RepID=A0AAV1JU21_9NEOP